MSNIRKAIYKLCRIYVGWPIRLSNKISFKITTEFIVAICDELQKIMGVYINLVCKPKRESQYSVLRMENKIHKNKIAIVLQGPLDIRDNFTLDTIKIYKKLFPNEEIIISTWQDAKKEDLELFHKTGCHIVLSNYPKTSGRGNVNYQIKSSLEGIKKAKELGCKYVIKSRTDQRISKANVVGYLYSLLKTFKPGNSIQNSRIVILQGSTGCMFLPYYIADFFYFGHVDEMLRLFSCKLENTHFNNREENNKADLEIYSKFKIGKALHLCAPQNYIMENYAREIGRIPNDTVKEYWDFIEQCTVPISVSQLGLIWRKYSNNIFENAWSHEFEFEDSEDQLLTYNWTFENWLSLISGEIKYDPKYEKYRLRKRVI